MTSKIDLLINSCDRTHGEPEDFRIQLHRPMRVRAIKLKRSIVPNTVHTINANNQMLTVENGSPTTKIVNLAIRAGNYTATELSTYLQTALNAHSELQGTWTVAKNIEDSFRLTITCTIGFTLHFTNENNPHRELGFVNGVSYTSAAVVSVETLYSPNMYKLGYDYLLLQSRSLQHNMETSRGISCFAQLPLNANSGSYAYNSEDYDGEHQVYETNKSISHLDFMLINPYGQKVDMNGVDYSLVFEVTH